MRCIRKGIPWLLVIIWMVVIFCFSHQPASQSSQLSSGITQSLLDVLEKIIPSIMYKRDFIHYFIRKSAHFFVYFILGLLVGGAFKSNGVRGYRRLIFSMLVCVLYAVSDEIHQVFIPGRSGQIGDVFIDSLGAFLGTGPGLFGLLCIFRK